MGYFPHLLPLVLHPGATSAKKSHISQGAAPGEAQNNGAAQKAEGRQKAAAEAAWAGAGLQHPAAALAHTQPCKGHGSANPSRESSSQMEPHAAHSTGKPGQGTGDRDTSPPAAGLARGCQPVLALPRHCQAGGCQHRGVIAAQRPSSPSPAQPAAMAGTWEH